MARLIQQRFLELFILETIKNSGTTPLPTIKPIKSTRPRQILAPLAPPKPVRRGIKRILVRKPEPVKMQIPQVTTKTPQLSALSKLQPFINNPGINAIECTGAGKPILIRQRGLSQVTKVILSEQEIKQIMQELSEKTRIPLLPGLFRAALGGLHVSAVVSEHVGIRFILEKRPSRSSQPNQR